MSHAYYNEIDPKAAAWLRELMADGLIMEGLVDERDIKEVQPADVRGFTRCHWFSGIGGWDYALQLAGWPDDVPAWTGSCPCQGLSAAGKGRGAEDERHLWPEFLRLIRECRPPVVFGEQVASPLGLGWLAGVRADLEAQGYAVGAADLCAPGVGAPHIRQRLYWVADAERPEPRLRDGQVGQTEIGRAGPAIRGADGRLDNAASARLHPKGNRKSNQSECGECGLGLGCCDGGLEYTQSGGAEAAQQPRCGGGAEQTGDIGGMGDSGGARLSNTQHQELPGPWRERQRRATAEPSGAPWANAVWHLCRDGRVRRIPIEPAFFPLADGLPGRVGLLRGAGNAIVPQVAAEFIKAYIEARRMT